MIICYYRHAKILLQQIITNYYQCDLMIILLYQHITHNVFEWLFIVNDTTKFYYNKPSQIIIMMIS